MKRKLLWHDLTKSSPLKIAKTPKPHEPALCNVVKLLLILSNPTMGNKNMTSQTQIAAGLAVSIVLIGGVYYLFTKEAEPEAQAPPARAPPAQKSPEA